jgi:hypothetical protein
MPGRAVFRQRGPRTSLRIGLRGLEGLAGLEAVAVLPDFYGGAARELLAIVELAIARLNHCLHQVALGGTAR